MSAIDPFIDCTSVIVSAFRAQACSMSGCVCVRACVRASLDSVYASNGTTTKRKRNTHVSQTTWDTISFNLGVWVRERSATRISSQASRTQVETSRPLPAQEATACHRETQAMVPERARPPTVACARPREFVCMQSWSFQSCTLSTPHGCEQKLGCR